MLLPRIRTSRLLEKGYRKYSHVAPNYHPKVRAFPFALSKDEAIRRLAFPASRRLLGKQVLGSLFGFNPVKPTRIQAVYLPAWFIDAEVSAQCWLSTGNGYDEEERQKKAVGHMTNSYMPGVSYDPLTRISFNNPLLYSEYDPEPWTNDMQRQHDQDIFCLPFTLSPLSLPRFVRSLNNAQATISDELRFDPRSIRPHLLAAYPVLIPLYLASYATEGNEIFPAPPGYSITAVLEAFCPNKGRVVFENAARAYHDAQITSGVSYFNVPDKMLQKDFLYHMGPQMPFSRFELFLAPLTSKKRVGELNEWVDEQATKPEAFEKLVENGGVNMEDKRVRQYTEEDTLENRTWMALGVEELLLNDMVETMSRADHENATFIRFGLGSRLAPDPEENKKDDEKEKKDTEKIEEKEEDPGKRKGFQQSVGPFTFESAAGDVFTKTLKGRIKDIEKKREEQKPDWLKEWEAQQELEKNS